MMAALLIAMVPARVVAQMDSAGDVIAVIQVQGNNVTPDAEVLALSGVAPGDPFTPETVDAVGRRLRETGRFEGVEVRKRYASIADLSQIALVIIVDEHAVRVLAAGEASGADEPVEARVVRRGLLRRAMWLPLLDAEDGYGVTYGAIAAFPGVAGNRSRLAVPLSWGGRRRAGVELDRAFLGGPISRLRLAAAVDQRRNPAFDEPDQRRRVSGRVERMITPSLRAGAEGGWEQVVFASEGDRFRSVGVDVTFDTRLDPGLPRNAVVLAASWTRMRGTRTPAFALFHTGAQAHLGLVGQSILTIRAERDTSTRAVPRYFKPLLGGWSNLRGFAAGAFAGDTRVVGGLELRVPVSSPLSLAKTGISVFIDAGKSYDHGDRFRDAPTHIGAGAGLWLTATVVQAGVSVAHGRHSGTRVNVGLGVTF